MLSKSKSPIWLFVSEIFQIPKGTQIPKNAKPIQGWLVATHGAILVKGIATSNIINYLGICAAITQEERSKWFNKAMKRNSNLKRQREDPSQ